MTIQSARVESILSAASIKAFFSCATERTPTEAFVIPVFRWKKEYAGVVIDCGEADGENIIVTGFCPEELIKDKSDEERIRDANDRNAYTSAKIFIKDSKAFIERTIDTSDGIHARVLINAIYDVIDVLQKYRSDARKRGIFPCDLSPGTEEESTYE